MFRSGTGRSRRSVVKAALVTGAGAAFTGCISPTPQPSTTQEPTVLQPSDGAEPSAVLLVYFSRAGENYHYGGRRDLEVGNTQVVAEMIAALIGCDTYRIEAADPYPEAYDPTVERNREEQAADARPAISGDLPDASPYDTVLLGSPIWSVRAPKIMSTFLDSVDLSGKTVLPFVTYAVSGMGQAEDDYREMLSDSDLRSGLAVLGETVTDAGPDVESWLRAEGMLR